MLLKIDMKSTSSKLSNQLNRTKISDFVNKSPLNDFIRGTLAAVYTT